MKSPPDNDPLRQLLREHWTVSPARTSDFRAAVWARLDATRRAPATLGAWIRIHVLGVTVVTTASLAIAGVGGGFIARVNDSHERDQLVQRYLVSIDPFQQVTAQHTAHETP